MREVYELMKEYLGGKREETLTNDESSMLTAMIWALKSKDPSTQVGSCFVNEEGRVISTGYNGTPKNWKDDDFPWRNDVDNIGERNTKYPYVIHAEMNGILNYKGSIMDFRNSTLYVTLFPCSNCAKLIVQAGIKKVVYLVDDRKDTSDNKHAKILLKNCNVECIDFNELKTKNYEKIKLIEYNKHKKLKLDLNKNNM